MGNVTLKMTGTDHTVTVMTERELIVCISFDMDIPDDPDRLCIEAKEQLQAYFCGRLKKFTLPYDIEKLGTPFFRKILHAIENIPYGETVSYKDAAIAAGSFAVRATGSALKKNPLPIIIPCHRIICADGTLGHYMGGRGDDIKKYLLSVEGVSFDDDNRRIVR